MSSELLPTAPKQHEPSPFGERIVDHLIRPHEDFLDKEVFEGRLRDYVVTVSNYGDAYREIIRDFIASDEGWSVDTRQNDGEITKATLSKTFFDDDGNGYLITITDRDGDGELGSALSDSTLSIEEVAALIKGRVNHALIMFKHRNAIERDKLLAEEGTTREDVLRDNYRERPEVIKERGLWAYQKAGMDDISLGLVMFSNVPLNQEPTDESSISSFATWEFNDIVNKIRYQRARIVAEEWTAGNEYYELRGQLTDGYSLKPEEREAIVRRLLDIQVMNDIAGAAITHDTAVAVNELYVELDQQTTKDDTWDAYSVQAAREVLVSPVTHVSLMQELNVQTKFGAALTKGLPGRTPQTPLRDQGGQHL